MMEPTNMLSYVILIQELPKHPKHPARNHSQFLKYFISKKTLMIIINPRVYVKKYSEYLQRLTKVEKQFKILASIFIFI